MRFVIDNESFEISRNDVISAARGVYPKPFDGRNKFYLELHGSKYPIKQLILSGYRITLYRALRSAERPARSQKTGFYYPKVADHQKQHFGSRRCYWVCGDPGD